MSRSVSALQRLFPFLAWPLPDARLLRSEMTAGLTVAMMIIPQGMAYASLAGMPPVTGIYASMLPALVAALYGASPLLSVGPTALTCLLVGSSIAGLAPAGSTGWIDLAVWLALLSGALQVLLGLLRFGWLLNLISAPVLMAFTQSAAMLIIASQVPALLGVRGGAPWWDLTAVHPLSAAFGLVSLAVLWALRRWKPGFPTVLVAVAASSGIGWWIGFAESGGAVVGPVPEGLPAPYLPSVPSSAVLGELLLPVLAITLVSFLETASSARVESERAGRPWDQNRDLIGQGLAKVASGFSGAFPTSSSFSRSALNLYAGARTGWASVASVVFVTGVLLFLTPLLRHAPRPVLAAIVLAAVIGMIRPGEFFRVWKASRAEALIAGATVAITLATAPDLYWGVLAGVVMALSHSIYQRLHPRIIEVGLHPDGSLRDRHLWTLEPIGAGVYAVRMDAALDFATAPAFERAVIEYLGVHPETRAVCLFAQSINRIDATGAEVFVKLCNRLRAHGIAFHVTGLKLPVERVLDAVGALTNPSEPRLHRTDAELIAAVSIGTRDEGSPRGTRG
ncbi:MAG: hypothetical protein RIS35_1979 [Pseudomonadota bacterium]|jgi:SulP family sulfate permease